MKVYINFLHYTCLKIIFKLFYHPFEQEFLLHFAHELTFIRGAIFTLSQHDQLSPLIFDVVKIF